MGKRPVRPAGVPPGSHWRDPMPPQPAFAPGDRVIGEEWYGRLSRGLLGEPATVIEKCAPAPGSQSLRDYYLVKFDIEQEPRVVMALALKKA